LAQVSSSSQVFPSLALLAMVFVFSMRLGASLRLLIPCLLLCVLRLESVRPFDGGSAGQHAKPVYPSEKKGSLVEVSARHFQLSRSKEQTPPESSKQLPQEDQTGPKDSSEDAASEGNGDPAVSKELSGGNEQEPKENFGMGQDVDTISQAENDRTVAQVDKLVDGESEQVPTAHRGGNQGSETYSTGSKTLDTLGEKDDTEPLSQNPAADPLFVSKAPELSHEEGKVVNGIDKRKHHFQEMLNLKPVVLSAVDEYKTGTQKAKESANDIYEQLDNSFDKVGHLDHTLGDVQKEMGHLKRAATSETRASASDSVNAFADYNRDGVYGADKGGKWQPEAGKWDVFKDLLFPGGKRRENI